MKAQKSSFRGWPRADLLAPREAPDIPGLRFRRPALRSKGGQGGPWDGVLTEIGTILNQLVAAASAGGGLGPARHLPPHGVAGAARTWWKSAVRLLAPNMGTVVELSAASPRR